MLCGFYFYVLYIWFLYLCAREIELNQIQNTIVIVPVFYIYIKFIILPLRSTILAAIPSRFICIHFTIFRMQASNINCFHILPHNTIPSHTRATYIGIDVTIPHIADDCAIALRFSEQVLYAVVVDVCLRVITQQLLEHNFANVSVRWSINRKCMSERMPPSRRARVLRNMRERWCTCKCTKRGCYGALSPEQSGISWYMYTVVIRRYCV